MAKAAEGEQLYVIGVLQRTGRPVGERTFSRMGKKDVCCGHKPEVHRDGPMALAWPSQRPEMFASTSDLVVLLDGWVSFRDPSHRGGPLPRHHEAAAVLEAWAKWGIDLVQHVEGEFTLAVYERSSATLHLITDPNATIPMFWARSKDRVAFASTPAALLELSWVSRELARENLSEYLAFRVMHAPRTLLRDVHRIPAGHRLRSGDESIRVVQYHHPTYAAPDTKPPRTQDVVPELTAAVERAVRRRLLNNADVGVYLSGGVGSTAIVAAARKASRQLRTYTVAFAEEPFPETSFAGRVAQLLGMDHTVITVGSKDVADHFEDAVRAMGHPVGNVSAVLQLQLAQAVRKDTPTALTGDGTDQLFGGSMLQGPAAKLRRAKRFAKLPMVVRAPVSSLLRAADRGHSVRVPPAELPMKNGTGGVHLFNTRQRRSLLLDESLVRPSVREAVLGGYYEQVDTDTLNRVLHAFYMSTLVADTLPRVVCTARSAGLRTSFPLLDGEVVRLAQLLPGSFKVDGVGRADLPTRWLLRAALMGAVPTALVNRPDRGMPRPLDDWLTGPGLLFMEDRFSQLREDPLELFHTTGLEALKRGLGRTPGATQRLWALFILDSWLRQIRAV